MKHKDSRLFAFRISDAPEIQGAIAGSYDKKSKLWKHSDRGASAGLNFCNEPVGTAFTYTTGLTTQDTTNFSDPHYVQD